MSTQSDFAVAPVAPRTGSPFVTVTGADSRGDAGSGPGETRLLGAVGPCPDPVQRVNRLYMVNTAAGNVRGQLRVLCDMSRSNGLPGWYCDRLQTLADSLLTVADLEAPNTGATPGVQGDALAR